MICAEIRVRSATASDWPAVSSLLAANGLPREGAENCLADFLLALRDDEVIGSIGLEIRGEIALLRSAAVVQRLQHRGVGTLLVGHALAEAGQRGLRSLYLLTTTAAHYFHRFGFTRLSRDQAPAALQELAEFRGACPGSAQLMVLELPAVP